VKNFCIRIAETSFRISDRSVEATNFDQCGQIFNAFIKNSSENLLVSQ